MVGIVDSEKLNNVITAIEKLMKVEELDRTEKQLVLGCINERFTAQLQAERSQDLMERMPLGGIMKRFTKQQDKEDE